MKALGLTEESYTLDAITELEVAEPDCKDNQVKVEVYSVGLNPSDYRMTVVPGPVPRNFPFMIGSDFAGKVTEIGKNVTKFHVGDDVYGKPQIPNFGTCAEYYVIDEELLCKKPAEVSYSQVCTVPVTFQTALMNLKRKADLKKDEYVLVLGGGGGVGSAAVQIAKNLGAHVWATGLSKDIEAIKKLNPEGIINTETDDLDKIPVRFDVMMDTVGLKAQQQVIGLMKDYGRIVSSAVIETDSSISDNKTLNFIQFEFAHGDGSDFELANELMASGEYVPSYETEHPFTAEGLKTALDRIWSNKKTGRQILKVK